MVDPQQLQQQGPSFINWSINIYDLAVLIGCAFLLYGRMVKIETQITPIVVWWNKMRENEAEHIGRRWTDDSAQYQKGKP